MSNILCEPDVPVSATASDTNHFGRVLAQLGEAFDAEWAIYDRQGRALAPNSADRLSADLLAPLLPAVLDRGCVEVLAEEPPLLLLAAPVCDGGGENAVAVAALPTGAIGLSESSRAARWLEADWPAVQRRLRCGSSWTADAAIRLVKAVLSGLRFEQRAERLEREVDEISESLARTYEEISLIYSVTNNLSISSSDVELGDLALDWLQEVVPAEALAIQYPPSDAASEAPDGRRCESELIHRGDLPLDGDGMLRLVEKFGQSWKQSPQVVNGNVTADDSWQFPGVREFILVPLHENDRVFGWLAAFNHTRGDEFGTIEASLLSSLGSILGIHSGNLDLYRRQAELMADVVRALTSAIDAKDPYTCGHSDRVARIAVRLGQELHLPQETLNRIYLGGLLHDIGKIGIDDNVLRKPGRLTEAEFEHIKLHPGLGHKILADLKELSDILPIVLHHHEQWDGRGYPHGLLAADTPLLARIVAVADAFDAMTSDRPYRKGMPVEKVHDIFRKGAGQQWDADVVEAYFFARDDIHAICNSERAGLSLNVEEWSR